MVRMAPERFTRQHLSSKCCQLRHNLCACAPPRVLIGSATCGLNLSSAAGFYGSSDSNTFNEGSASGQDYLAEVCREWEAAANSAEVSHLLFVS